MNDRLSGLWLHVAVGVALGIVFGVVMLYGLWLLQLRLVIDPALREVFRPAAGELVVPQRLPASTPVDGARLAPAVKSARCRPDEVLGEMNGNAVCVGRSSGIARQLGE